MKKYKREDLIDEVKQVSEEDDSLGYDIESFDFDKNGNEYKIYIEVKTTTQNANADFFITDNELKVMNEKKEKYWIYRVSKNKKNKNVFHKINGRDFSEKMKIESYVYRAKIKCN